MEAVEGLLDLFSQLGIIDVEKLVVDVVVEDVEHAVLVQVYRLTLRVAENVGDLDKTVTEEHVSQAVVILHVELLGSLRCVLVDLDELV